MERIDCKDFEKLLQNKNLKKYDVCGICGVSPRTVDRWLEAGVNKIVFEFIKNYRGD